MEPKKTSGKGWLPKLAAGVLVTGVLLGMALAAGQQGTQDDPLVSLSFLNQKAAPAIMEQVESKIAEENKALTEQLDDMIKDFSKQMSDKLAKAGGSGIESAAFQVVDVAEGQRLAAGIGCEIMLRVGDASCYTNSPPGFIDMTGGGTLENGQALARNHLYMATIDGRGLTAKTAVKVLVRGPYTIE